MIRTCAILLFLASSAAAQGCPPAPDNAARLERVVRDLANSRGPEEARIYTQDLWEIWLVAPDALAQAMLDEGMALREMQDFVASRSVLNRLVDYCPDYPEGYNQRAFSSFLMRDFEPALDDLNSAIALMPNHVAALAGKGLTLLGMGRDDEAQDALRAAVAINPWLSERALITGPIPQDI